MPCVAYGMLGLVAISKAPVYVLVGIAVVASAVMLRMGPIDLPPSYHQFADQREILGIPNALNVVSNAPFAIVGALGLVLILRRRLRESWAVTVLFLSAGLTAFGSAYYHLAPRDARLFWDRAPMAIVFMAVFTLVLVDRLGSRAGRLLAPLVVLGLGSVVYWRHTALAGAGDLRLYILVQYFPVVAIPLLVWFYPPRYTGASLLVGAAAWYGAAKIFEVLDGWVLRLGGVVSGHTLKHAAAGMAAYWLYRWARDRQPISIDAQKLYKSRHSM